MRSSDTSFLACIKRSFRNHKFGIKWFDVFEIVFSRHQKELIEKDRLEEERRNRMKMEFCNDLKKQICEKEQQRIAERNAFFEEGVRMEEEARLRRLRLEDAKNRKMEELRQALICFARFLCSYSIKLV